MNSTLSKIILVVLWSFCWVMMSCGGNQNNAENQNTKAESQRNTAQEATIVALTDEQIKTAGIQLGFIEYKELRATIRANGVLKVPNSNKGNATSLYGGVIQKMNVQIGDRIQQGQVVATIANPQFIQMQEEYLSINSKIVFAEQELQRQEDLNRGNAGAKKNLQAAAAELNILRARRASLQQQLQLMGIDPSSITGSNMHAVLAVTSPISGTVSKVFAKIGSYTDVATPVIEVVDNSFLHLDLQVFEKDLPKIKVGQIIHFTLTNNPTKEYDAKVFSIGSSFENDSKTIAIHCTVTGNKAELIDGMNVTGIISLSHATTPAVPNDAIVESNGQFYIFVQTNRPQSGSGVSAHEHNHEHEPTATHQPKDNPYKTTNFEKIAVIKGISDMGYTAITFIKDVSNGSKIVTQGVFFVNAKLSNTGEHEH